MDFFRIDMGIIYRPLRLHLNKYNANKNGYKED